MAEDRQLEQELHDARRMVWLVVHAAGGQVTIPASQMLDFSEQHSQFEITHGADGSLHISAIDHTLPNGACK